MSKTFLVKLSKKQTDGKHIFKVTPETDHSRRYVSAKHKRVVSKNWVIIAWCDGRGRPTMAIPPILSPTMVTIRRIDHYKGVIQACLKKELKAKVIFQ